MSKEYLVVGSAPYDIEFEPVDLLDNLLREMEEKAIQKVQFTLHHTTGDYEVQVEVKP